MHDAKLKAAKWRRYLSLTTTSLNMERLEAFLDL